MNVDTPSKTATRLRQITNRDAEIEYEDQERTLRTSILLLHQSYFKSNKNFVILRLYLNNLY